MTWKVRSNLWLYAFTRYWLHGAIAFWLIFATLPWMAPVLMKIGATGPANTIYSLYTPMCHRFAFRSFFLFGDQAAYPLAAAESSYASFESYAGVSRIPSEMRASLLPQPPFGVRSMPEMAGTLITGNYYPVDMPDDLARGDSVNFARAQFASASVIGNETLGYKTAVCERDLSIYAGLGLGALIFAIPRVRRKLRPLPIVLYFFIGLAPIGIDGFSQLLSYAPFEFWPARETLPVFRVLTGFLFGLATGWLGYPNIELSMRDTGRAIRAKLVKAGYGEHLKEVD